MSDLARQLIAENKRTRDPFLDLGNCGLTELPLEISDLVWLESLSLATEWWEWDGSRWQGKRSQNRRARNERLTSIAPLRPLTRLRSLCLNGTKVADLVPLADLSALQLLDVSRTQIADLAPLAGLSALRVLYVTQTEVADLAPLAGLSALQELHVHITKVADLAPLAGLSALQTLSVWGTKVADLAPLAGLSALQHLYVSNTKVANLAPLAGLPALQTLFVWGTQVADLAPLAGLPALQSLDVSKTQVADLAPLAGLPALQSLNVSKTQVADLAPLAGLPALQTLDVSGTQVADLSPLLPLITRGLPVKWSERSWEGPGIYVENCPLKTPPPEIVKQGNDAILNYFRERAKGAVDHLYEAKMLLLGEGGAGKTSLLRRLYQPGTDLPAESESTKGIEIHAHPFTHPSGRPFRLNVWDFGGQEIYHATHQFFLTRRSLYVLVDDTRKDHKSVSDEGFKYWLDLVDVFGGRSPVLIFQNEKSGRSKAIDLAGIKGRFDNVERLFKGDLFLANSADELREAIEFYAAHLPHIGDELPAPWIKVRAEIETLAREKPYISRQDYFDVYRRHLDFDETRALHLSRYFHDLGVILHFQDDSRLARTVILQNEWATEAVFRILDDESIKANRGRFTLADCRRLWADSRYAEMHLELLQLMQRFDLSYELRDIQPETWLATQLLPPSKPASLKEWSQPGDLVLRYKYDFLPKGMISRLTVRLHRFVRNPEQAWTNGVLFERAGTNVLVELLPAGGEIELRARGPERKELLSVVAADLDALNDGFPGLRDKVDKRIPCLCSQCRATATPVFFPQKELLRRKQDNRLSKECPHSYENVDVLELLDGIKVPQPPTWAHEQPSRTIKIFLASSAELREDRDAFDLHFRQHNDQLRKEGLYLEIVRWENFLDAMSETRLQDEYNTAIQTCDIFVSLFFTKTGKYTEEEFDVAHRQFKSTAKPRIFTFFRKPEVIADKSRRKDLQSLWAFQEKLEALGHFWTNYDNTEDLILQFRTQLDKLGVR